MVEVGNISNISHFFFLLKILATELLSVGRLLRFLWEITRGPWEVRRLGAGSYLAVWEEGLRHVPFISTGKVLLQDLVSLPPAPKT